MATNNLNKQNNVELQKLNEKSLFTDESKTKDVESNPGCCRSKHTKNCCIATGAFGCVFLILGIVVMLVAPSFLKEKILKTMALVDGSDRYESWLRPPVQPHLEAYAFHITNPEAVLAGEKPILKEVGPFIYKSETIKDSDDNVKWWGDGTLTYRPRKNYQLDRSKSAGDPDTTKITIPNIPWWTGIHKAQKQTSSFAKNTALGIVRDNGLNKPFIEVTFSGLLWGYEDELPCLKMDQPSECVAADASPFGGGGGGAWGDDDDDDSWASFDDAEEEVVEESEEKEGLTSSEAFGGEVDELFEPVDSDFDKMVKPKAEFVDCKCNWGLFRDRNMTLRRPTRIFTGETDLSLKGVVAKYDGRTTHNWWKEGSVCDKVKGQDSSTLPPGLTKDRKLEIFIALMCRTIKMEYEKDVTHADINTYRFIPPANALGRHDETIEKLRNEDNECYCVDKFKCLKSGVMYMEPCKRDTEAPVALSMPHFYQAHPDYLKAVEGLKPEKEKHQFYMDVVPEFGFPLAIRPRFQLNIVISGDNDVPVIKNIPKDLVMPFLWAQDGFDEPSEEMASAIAFGLVAPEKLSLLGSIVFLVIGAILLLSCLAYFLWLRRSASQKITYSN